MAWTDLKAAVAAVIKTNGNQEITGALLQSTLNSIIDQVGANASYKGVAIPSTNPGTPDALVFYIASTQGTYANFGGFVLDGGFAVLSNVSGSWTGTKILKTEMDAKANHGYESNPKTLKEVDDNLSQLAGDIEMEKYYTPKFQIGKNKFDKNDPDNVENYRLNIDGTLVPQTGRSVIGYIPIEAGQTLYCNKTGGVGFPNVLFDVFKNVVGHTTTENYVTALQDGFCRFTLYTGGVGYQATIDACQVEEGTSGTEYEAFSKTIPYSEYQDSLEKSGLLPKSKKIITVNRLGTSGVDADFCGQTAIQDALASITDASENSQYLIIIKGVFLITDPLEVPKDPRFTLEYSMISAKPYVDIEGISKRETVISLEIPANATFHPGKSHTDYQPVAWNSPGSLRNMTIIGKNCRYALHIDGGDENAVMNFENLLIIHKGNLDYGVTSVNAIGTGMVSGKIFNFRNCEVIGTTRPFGVHSYLAPHARYRCGIVNFLDCTFDGDYFGLDSYPMGHDTYVNFINPKFVDKKAIIQLYQYYRTSTDNADYNEMRVMSTSDDVLVYMLSAAKGRGLKIKSKSIGETSSVRFDKDCTAFNAIIGYSNKTVLQKTEWNNDYQYGYEYRDGGISISGYAIGHKDCDSGNTTKSNGLGILLGDCTSVNKTLTVIIDGLSYDIVFDEDYTAQNNAYVISKIMAVIGEVADADTISVTAEYYPDLPSLRTVINSDTVPILKGMGVVISSSLYNSVRIAKNSDNKIDGIALDDFAPGAVGRISKANFYSFYKRANPGYRYTILETISQSRASGTLLGISEMQAGYFDPSSNPKLLFAFKEDCFAII